MRHVLSAPVSPPRSPVLLVVLVTKKLTVFTVVGPVALSLPHDRARSGSIIMKNARVIVGSYIEPGTLNPESEPFSILARDACLYTLSV